MICGMRIVCDGCTRLYNNNTQKQYKIIQNDSLSADDYCINYTFCLDHNRTKMVMVKVMVKVKEVVDFLEVKIYLLFVLCVVLCHVCVCVTDMLNRTDALRTALIDYPIASGAILLVIMCFTSAKVRG